MNEKLIAVGNTLGTAILRVVIGFVFMAHGWRKIMAGFDAVSQAFAQSGIPAPVPAAILVSLVELLGGLLLVVGLKTRLAAIPLSITMLVAMLAVHFQNGFFLPQGYEYTLVLLAALVTLALVGPGSFSADRFLGRRSGRERTEEERGNGNATTETIEREGSESA